MNMKCAAGIFLTACPAEDEMFVLPPAPPNVRDRGKHILQSHGRDASHSTYNTGSLLIYSW